MLKIILLIVALIIVGVGIYYGRFLFTKRVVQEEFPQALPMEETSAMSAAPSTPVASEVPRVVKSGNFVDIDFIHKGSGRALILQDAQGHAVLRFEDFQVTNGPDLYVYLSKSSNPKEDLGEFVNLGRLKGTVGNQNYEINQDISQFKSAVIWCQQFGVLFSFANLQ